jgi:hypothetical protein
MDHSPPHLGSQTQRGPRRRWRGRVGATAFSAGAHAALLVALLLSWRAPPLALDLPPIVVSLAAPLAVAPPKPPAAPSPSKPAAKRKAPQQPAAAPRLIARASPAPPVPDSLPMPPAKTPATGGEGDSLTGAQLAGATSVGDGDGAGGDGGGGGGGECNMARRVQMAVRKDPLARAAIHAAGGGAITIWNGDWVQSGAEDGKGLAAVREAITWEVAFAPPACRQQRMRGLILLSLNDGSARLALGAGNWRWSDLLGLR